MRDVEVRTIEQCRRRGRGGVLRAAASPVPEQIRASQAQRTPRTPPRDPRPPPPISPSCDGDGRKPRGAREAGACVTHEDCAACSGVWDTLTPERQIGGHRWGIERGPRSPPSAQEHRESNEEGCNNCGCVDHAVHYAERHIPV